jgi:hypothetical protein
MLGRGDQRFDRPGAFLQLQMWIDGTNLKSLARGERWKLQGCLGFGGGRQLRGILKFGAVCARGFHEHEAGRQQVYEQDGNQEQSIGTATINWRCSHDME